MQEESSASTDLLSETPIVGASVDDGSREEIVSVFPYVYWSVCMIGLPLVSLFAIAFICTAALGRTRLFGVTVGGITAVIVIHLVLLVYFTKTKRQLDQMAREELQDKKKD